MLARINYFSTFELSLLLSAEGVVGDIFPITGSAPIAFVSLLLNIGLKVWNAGSQDYLVDDIWSRLTGKQCILDDR